MTTSNTIDVGLMEREEPDTALQAIAGKFNVSMDLVAELGDLIAEHKRSCEVVLENRTNECLIHHSVHVDKGTIRAERLPAVPPRYGSGDEEIVFGMPVGITSRDKIGSTAPVAVMVWKFAKREVYLVVFVCMHLMQRNGGSFGLYESQVDAAEWFKKTAKHKKEGLHKDVTNPWWTSEKIPEKCNIPFRDERKQPSQRTGLTVQGIFGSDEKHPVFRISIAPV